MVEELGLLLSMRELADQIELLVKRALSGASVLPSPRKEQPAVAESITGIHSKKDDVSPAPSDHPQPPLLVRGQGSSRTLTFASPVQGESSLSDKGVSMLPLGVIRGLDETSRNIYSNLSSSHPSPRVQSPAHQHHSQLEPLSDDGERQIRVTSNVSIRSMTETYSVLTNFSHTMTPRSLAANSRESEHNTNLVESHGRSDMPSVKLFVVSTDSSVGTDAAQVSYMQLPPLPPVIDRADPAYADGVTYAATQGVVDLPQSFPALANPSSDSLATNPSPVDLVWSRYNSQPATAFSSPSKAMLIGSDESVASVGEQGEAEALEIQNELEKIDKEARVAKRAFEQRIAKHKIIQVSEFFQSLAYTLFSLQLLLTLSNTTGEV